MTIIAMAQAENDKEAVRIEYDPKSDIERQEVTRRLLDFWRREYEEAFGARDESETAVYPYLITYTGNKNGETCFETVKREFSHRPPTYAELERVKQAERETCEIDNLYILAVVPVSD